MAAAAAVIDAVPLGGVVVAPQVCYTGTRGLLADLAARGRLECRLVDMTRPVDFGGVDLVWIESPANPTVDVYDVPALATAAHAAGAQVAVDSTLATPLAFRPLEHGADVVVHSVTKYLSGHSDLVLGATVAGPEWHATLQRARSRAGAIPGPMEAYLALRGLRTLPVRLRAATANATELAQRLRAHPAVDYVRYPGLADDPGHAAASAQLDGYGAMLAVVVRGGAAAADAVLERCRLVVPATSLGGVETTAERRAKLAGEEHVEPGLLRVSVGCEDVQDLWRDLDQALRTDGSAA